MPSLSSRRRPLRLAATALIGVGAVALGAFFAASPANAADVTQLKPVEYQTTSTNVATWGVTTGADGNIWFTEGTTRNVGVMNPDGTMVAEYPTVPATNDWSLMGDIVLGPDGNYWFNMPSNQQQTAGKPAYIGRMTPAGVFTAFTSVPANSYPEDIISSGGFLWVIELDGNAIAKIDTNGNLVASYPIPSGQGAGVIKGQSLVAGPDGNIYFTEPNTTSGNKVGRLNTTTGVMTEFPAPTGTSGPFAITSAGGALWVVFDSGHIAKMTTAGAFTVYPIPTTGGVTSGPQDITADKEGNLWFTDYNANKVGQMTEAGVFTMWTVPGDPANTTAKGPTQIAMGPDDLPWWSYQGNPQVRGESHPWLGTFQIVPPVTPTPTATPVSTQTSSAAPELAATGSNVDTAWPFGLAALVFLLGGGALLVVTRRRSARNN